MNKTMNGLILAGLCFLFSQVSLADLDPGRTALTGPGEAEVIAGTGYEHTLFDSADNKCQHCHNDLYDTWKTSMHAKSWKDPIFQSKYQDFLRLQASKIGAVGPTGTYSKGTLVNKTSKVCVKCHAPTAFYSGDHKVTVTEVGDQNKRDEDEYEKAEDDPNTFEYAKANLQRNLVGKDYDFAEETTVASMDKSGKVYTVTYHIGNSHNREGINCSYCHSMETVRMFNDVSGKGDSGQYTLATPIKMGPIGPKVREAGETLYYSPDASTLDMNAFFALIGPDIGKNPDGTPNVQNTAKEDFVAWDGEDSKKHMGRYVMKSISTGCENYDEDGNCVCEAYDDHGNCVSLPGYYTGGPFYGPFGVTGLSNSRDDDLSKRDLLVKQEFEDAVAVDHGDKFESKHQFAAYGKALCLSCHQRSSLMLNPDSNGVAGVQPKGDNPDQFLELCSTWTAMSDGVGNNFEDTKASPKCQRCHMEPLTEKNGEAVTVLHQWDQPDTLFTLADNPDLTEHFLPPVDGGVVGPVAEGYLNNHAFMGANTSDGIGMTKIKTGFESDMEVEVEDGEIEVETYLQNKTAHMFPGAHPMRRVMTRIIVTDANGDALSFKKAKGKSKFKSVTNQVAVLDGDAIMPGFEAVDVMYDKNADVVIQGYGPDLPSKKPANVSSQEMNQSTVKWDSPDATVQNSAPECTETDPDTGDCTVWVIRGDARVTKITDIDGTANHFTRIYGRETGKRKDGQHVVRPGFDSVIAADNRLKPNEREKYTVVYDTEDVAFPLTVRYKVYYLKKGASGKAPTLTSGPDKGFLDTSNKKDAIFEVFSKEEIIE